MRSYEREREKKSDHTGRRNLGGSMKNWVVSLTSVFCLAFCITPSNAQETAGFKTADISETFKVLRLDGNSVRWSKPANGGEVVLSYRVLAQPQAFANARNCRKMTAPDALLTTSGVPGSAFRQELAAAFAMWEQAAGVTFREASEGAPANILIGAQVDPEGWAFADVFYDAASPQVIKPISQALICLNPTRRWKVGFDGDLKAYDLRYALAHEIGHAIGLDHPGGAGQIMGYRYEERFRELQPGDVRGAVTLYGERQPQTIATVPAQKGTSPPADAQPSASALGTRAFEAPSP